MKAKKICFPATFRGHLARQKNLLEELKKRFEVDIFEPKTKPSEMSIFAIICAIEFNNFLVGKDYDGVLIRGDRYEMLGLAMVSAYKGIKIIHIEGGDLSGAIDNKVRHAITNLADYHFCTNEESHRRLINMGVPTDKVWNFGSLDVEYSLNVKPNQIRDDGYIVVAYHPILGEDEKELDKALLSFLHKHSRYKIENVISNNDYGRQYGRESYSSEDYINLLRYSDCMVGNSSSFLKEASILGIPVVDVGERQTKRLKPRNVLSVPCRSEKIEKAIEFQIKNSYEPDLMYYQPETSKQIADRLDEMI